MSRFSLKLLLANAASAVLLAMPLAARATIVNIDLNGQRDTDALGPTYAEAGAAGGGTTFNGITANSELPSPDNDNLTVAGSSLLNDAGGATSVGFTIGLVGGDNNGAGTDNTNAASLFNDYVFNNSAGNSGTATFTISGLGAGSTATLYFYTSQSFSSLSVTGGSAVGSPTLSNPYTTSNTKVFTATADGSGDITGTLGGGLNVLSGLTIDYTVPEPASLGLLGIAGLGLLGRRRRTPMSRS